jgi:hypothetical protein
MCKIQTRVAPEAQLLELKVAAWAVVTSGLAAADARIATLREIGRVDSTRVSQLKLGARPQNQPQTL